MVFHFRFEKILELKVNIENEKKQKLAYFMSQINKFNQEIKVIETEKQKLQQQLFEPTLMKDPSYRASISDYMNNGQMYILRVKEKIKELEPYIKEARENYFKARKDRAVFDHLKEKAYQKFLEEKKKKEKQEIEFYGQRNYLNKLSKKEGESF
jgi:flagellar export protein FliJ